MRYPKAVTAALIGLGTAAPAVADIKTLGDWEFYGRAHFSIDYLKDGADYSRVNGSSNSSRLGFRGSKTFGDLTAVWQIEQEIFFNLNGANNDAINRFATRDTFAGIKGEFGQVRFGKFDTPFKVARGPADLFGDQLGDMRNLTRVGSARFDERLNNTLEYQSPDFNGLRGKLAYALHEGASAAVTAGANRKDSAVSVALHFTSGGLDAALAFEDYARDAANGDRDAARLALSYMPIKELKLVGFYQKSSHPTNGGSTAGVGAEYQVLPKFYLRGHYYNFSADQADANAAMLALGAEYRHDPALRFYVNVGVVDNDPASALTPWVQGRSTSVAGSAGQDAHGLSLGMRYDF